MEHIQAETNVHMVFQRRSKMESQSSPYHPCTQTPILLLFLNVFTPDFLMFFSIIPDILFLPHFLIH